MKKHKESRRAFLIGTAVGASAVAGAGLVPNALAQTHEQHNAADVPATTAQGHAHAGGHGAFLNDDHAVTVTALAERIMPGAPGKPGARDAGVLNYIDLALAGAYSDLQDFYRRGLAALDAHSRTTYSKPFAQLTAAQQDEVITALEGGKATGFTWPSAQAFFNTVHAHDGRHVRRPRLWRQQGLRGLGAGRVSRRATPVLTGGFAEQGRLRRRADHRPAGSVQNRDPEDMSHGNRKDRCRHHWGRRGGRHSRGRTRQSRHEGDRARARPTPDHSGLQPA